MTATKIEIGRRARRDLISIDHHLRTEASPRTADRVMIRIERRIEALEQFPFAGQIRDEFGAECRCVLSPPYLILYRVEARLSDRTVIVLRVVHGARNLPDVDLGE